MIRATSTNVWNDLAAPCAPVPDAIRARLDEVVAGEWDFTLDPLGMHSAIGAPGLAFKGRLQVLGVIREAVGTGVTYEIAADWAFVGAARLFGVGVVVPEPAEMSHA